MYPIYFEQAHNQLSLNDYLQLQALLRQEQAEREHRLLQEYKKQQEQRRIQKAMHRLQVMTELYRRREQEELAIQAYYAKKKHEEEQKRRRLIEQQKRLLIQRQQQQQREYAAALQQRQEYEDYCNRMALALQQQHQQEQQQKSASYAHPCQALSAAAAALNNAGEHESEEESEAEEDEESHQHQLASLINLIFGAQQEHGQEAEKKPVQEPTQEPTTKQVEQKVEPEQENQEQYTMSLDQFVDYISKKAQALDDSDNEEQEGAADEEMEEDDTALLAMEHIDDDESMDEEEDDFEHIDNEEQEDIAALAIEHIDEHEEDEEVPSLVNSNGNLQELVNNILTVSDNEEESNESQFPDEDPVKIAKYDALSRIEQELNEIRQNHEDHVLNIALDFSDALQHNNERSESPDSLITATTAANREFLGYEDQIMKILLRLDMIGSDGDESIRNERKNLVKIAEQMLDKLDEFKQKEWERVSCSSHSDEEMDL